MQKKETKKKTNKKQTLKQLYKKCRYERDSLTS